MVLMPAPPPKDLAGYLHCLDNGVSYKYKEDPSYNFPIYNWSVRRFFLLYYGDGPNRWLRLGSPAEIYFL